MKLFVLAAFIAVVSSGHLDKQQPESHQDFPWKTGKQYLYDVHTHTLSRIYEGPSAGSVFKGNLIIRVKSPGLLQARLLNSEHAQFHQHLHSKMVLPVDLKYEPVRNLNKPFEIFVDGGRFKSMNLPSSISVENENLIKGLISALQLDLSPHHQISNSYDEYDKEHQQGLFKKFETDVTGDCETLYSVSPVAADWRRELPQFALKEDPIEISKSRNYGHCHHRVAYHFGVPRGAEWTGTAHKNSERQFITHSSVARILVGKQGPIYKAETTSSVHVHPHVYGKQKAEVLGHVQLLLVNIETDDNAVSIKRDGIRQVMTLLYAMSNKQKAIHYQSSEESSEEFHEHIRVPFEDLQSETRKYNGSEFPGANKHKPFKQSSSSSDSSSAYVNDDMPSMNEPVYAAMYFGSQPQADKKLNPNDVQKLLFDMTQQLLNPHTLTKADFFGKFSILVRLIASMTSEELAETSRSIELAKTPNNIAKDDMWMIYRDAVIQSGTPPAFQQFKTWVKSKKIYGEHAAQAASSLAKTLRYPTKEIMTQFFDLALSPEVQEQNLFNSSALLAATTFIRRAHVHNETALRYYPTQMYGHLVPMNDRFVLDYILPKLSEKLNRSLEKDERSKAIVYIKAIGNLGHREILQIFAPYFEGHPKVSTYLRVQMISELRHVVGQNERHVRDILYRVMINTAEAYEVRVAAILNLFRAYPTTAMMQVMAEMTIVDPSIHVRATLKYGIETAASLKDPRYWHLAKSAQAVKDMVTQENLGIWYSNAMFFDNYDSDEYENDPNYRETSQIGSGDSFVPKKERLTWRYKLGGLSSENNIDFSFSSAKDFADFIKQFIYKPLKSNAMHKYSAKNISEMLNFKNQLDELESSFYFGTLNHERFFALDEVDLIKLARDVVKYLKEMEKGVEMHYTKVFNARQISVMFPLASGVPFIYKYKEPILIHIYSKANGTIDEKNYVPAKMNKEIIFTVATNVDGSVGFMNTLSNKLASAGVVKKYQLNLSLKMNIETKTGEFKLRMEPLQSNQDTTIAHFSIWPYSSIQQRDSLIPLSQDSSTKLIQRPKKVSNTDFKFGQEIGSIFHLQGYSFSKNFRYVNEPLQTLFNIRDFIEVQDLAQTHYNLRYLGKPSKNKAFIFTAVYGDYYNQQQSGEFGNAENYYDVRPNSIGRRLEIIERVSSGIHAAEGSVLDLSVEFEGSQKAEYLFTGAFAYSPVDRKKQAAIFLGRNSAQKGNCQINANLKIHRPELTPLNYLESLKRNIEATYELDVKQGQNANIHVQANLERSPKYTDQLHYHPMARECEKEMNQTNYYQLACHKMLVRAHAPDHIKASVTYKNISPWFLRWASQAYDFLKPLAENTEPNPMKKLADGNLELEAEALYSANSLRFNVTSPNSILRLDNIPIPDYAPYLVSSYSLFSAMSGFEHFANFKTENRYQPFCTIDGENIKTFSSRSYDYPLSRSWHVVMHQEDSLERGKWEELLILSRRPSEKQQEVYVSHKTSTGDDLEIEILPSAASNKTGVKVKTLGRKISDGILTTYSDSAAVAPLLQYYVHPDSVLLLNIRNGHIRIMFDGQRLVVSTSEYRKSTRGVCGRNTGELRDDYETPNGVVDHPHLYGPSFALDDNSDPKTLELKKQAQQSAYQPKTKYTIISRIAPESKQPEDKIKDEDESIYRTRSYKKLRGPCEVQQQVQYHENLKEICITTTPLAACQSHCRGEGYQVQSVQVVCKLKSSSKFQLYKIQIQKGLNPNVSGKTKQEKYRVPSSCIP